LARKILLADDSVTAQNMGRRILSDAGYEVITVNNGSAALKKIAELTPDLIVLDVYMPGYGGLEVCQRLKESQATSRIPVLLTVGKLEPFKADEARRVRADGHIIKPFDANELLAAIMRLEDRIVPQPGPTKPGRFAKAISSAEETSSRRKREKSSDPAGETTSGWKRRLSIPRNPAPEQDEKETAQQSAGTAFYDLSPRTESKPAKAETAIPSNSARDSSVAEASDAPTVSFEKFVELTPLSKSTPAVEDVAADLQAEPQPKAEAIVPETPVADQPSSTAAFVPGSDQSADGAEVLAALATLSPAVEVSETVKTAKTGGDIPFSAFATVIAAVSAVCKGPRWVADPVPLSDGDSHLLLELEMEKAYAAFAAAESARNPLPETVTEVDPPAIETAIVMASPQSSAESLLSLGSGRESAIADAEIKEKDTASSDASDGSSAGEPILTAATEPEEQPTNLVATTIVQPSASETETNGNAPAEAAASIGFRDIAFAAAASASSVAGEPNRGTAVSSGVESSASQEVEAATNATDDTPIQPESTAFQPATDATSPEASSGPLSGSQEAQLATAWQNWRQIRESIIGQQLPSQVADAATAAFKQIREEQKDQMAGTSGKDTESSEENRAAAEASTISGIVDSVLSELKPKLMEEIAKKLAAERK
jgi:CheY-like chemotaxis protein